MEYTKIDLLPPTKRSRRTKRIDLDSAEYTNHVYFDLLSSPFGSDDNYFAILIGPSASLELAFGGAYNESDSEHDPLPDDLDFHLFESNTLYEGQGRLFNRNLRVWLRGSGAVTLVY